MSSVFPVDLKRLKDSEKDIEKEPLDLARIQNEALRLSLEEVRVQLVQQTRILERMEQKFERRTAVFSPAKGYSNEAYMTIHSLFTPMHKSWTPPQLLMQKRALVKTRDCMKLTTTLSGPFSVPHLPERAANLVWPPIFGQKYVAWPEIFPLIHDPQNFGSAFEKSQNGLRPKQASIQSLQRLKLANWRHSEIILQNGVRMNALAKHLTEQRKVTAPAAATVGTTGPIDGSDNLTSGNGDGAEVTSSSTIPAKRKAPIASRAKSAKFPKRK
ncbi:hypothetical protein C8J57DRAFT_1213997 [Mycena rebaudengoi]|nr:hypothetical protein C8J57DRAFT_1213997 [Mycena rebaudengoi]